MSGQAIEQLKVTSCIEVGGLILIDKCMSCDYCKPSVSNVAGKTEIKNYCKSPKHLEQYKENLKELQEAISDIETNGILLEIGNIMR